MLEAKKKHKNKTTFSRKDKWTLRNKIGRGEGRGAETGGRRRGKKVAGGKEIGQRERRENVGDALSCLSTFQLIRHVCGARP